METTCLFTSLPNSLISLARGMSALKFASGGAAERGPLCHRRALGHLPERSNQTCAARQHHVAYGRRAAEGQQRGETRMEEKGEENKTTQQKKKQNKGEKKKSQNSRRAWLTWPAVEGEQHQAGQRPSGTAGAAGKRLHRRLFLGSRD